MFFDVKSAEHVGGYKIRLSFGDGSSGVADLSDYVSATNVFRAFRDPNYFADFRVEYGTLVWGEGDIDIAPEALYERASGKPILYERQRSLV